MPPRDDVLGVVPIIPVPFTAQEEVDEEALRGLVNFAVQSGMKAICLPAYGSEFYKLSDDERRRVVEIAAAEAASKILVFAQSNHGSARIAAVMARSNLAAGAGAISIAIPRQFALPEESLLRYLATVLDAVDAPCLVQDFNPGGPTGTVEFFVELKRRCANLRYLKLEEPLMAPRVQALRDATDDAVGILEGWGGMYMLELIPAGICGLMPGLALADILNRIFHLRRAASDRAFQLFEKVLPQIVFSLQNMESFLYCEKRLLAARGLLANAVCRTPCYIPDAGTAHYVDELNQRILAALEELTPI